MFVDTGVTLLVIVMLFIMVFGDRDELVGSIDVY